MTLLELLVTVAVIGILVAMLLPFLGSVRKDAHRINCTSNMRQLGQALIMYASDQNDSLPYPTVQVSTQSCWFNAVDPYLLRLNPAGSGRNLSDVKQDPAWRTMSGSGTASTIKMNKKLALSSGSVSNISTYVIKSSDFIRIAHLAEPSKTVLLFDGRARDSHPTATADHSRFDGWETYVYPRHRGRANVLFADGHVELRTAPLTTAGSLSSGWLTNASGLIWWGK